VLANAGRYGFYRVNYSEPLWSALTVAAADVDQISDVDFAGVCGGGGGASSMSFSTAGLLAWSVLGVFRWTFKTQKSMLDITVDIQVQPVGPCVLCLRPPSSSCCPRAAG
jgi:hypothetical protein